jgi:hypothetical protein
VLQLRIVIYDRKADDLTVYNASAFTVSDGYIILGADRWRGFFPTSRFDFVGLDETAC